jgi:hypothetical protein
MTIQANFPAIKPSLLLDFANTKQLDSRITYTRASTASFYNGVTTAMAEQNLHANSQSLTATYVLSGGTGTLTANTTTAPDGTTTAASLVPSNGSTSLAYYGNTVFPASINHTISVYAKANGMNFVAIGTNNSNTVVEANLSTGAISGGTGSIVSVGNGWYRITAQASTYANTVYYVQVRDTSGTATLSTSNGTSGIYVWGPQIEQRSSSTAYTATSGTAITNYIPVLQTAASGVARFDNNPTTGESLGLLIEESRANLLPYSEQFDNAAWTKSQITVSANTVVAPDGTLTADGLIESATNTQKFAYQGLTLTAATYTLSVYARRSTGSQRWLSLYPQGTGVTASAIYDVNNGTVTATAGAQYLSSTITAVGNNWYRCTLTFTAAAVSVLAVIYLSNASTGLPSPTYTGDGFSGLYTWGMQLEAGSFATSYIPTVASQVTRAADAASMTGTNFTSWYRADEGTLFIDANGWQPQLVFSNANSGYNNYRSIYRASAQTNQPVNVYEANNGTAAVNTVNIGNTNGLTYKAAYGFKTNDFAGSVNAGTVATDTSGLPALAVDRMGIGIDYGVSATTISSGIYRKIAFYPLKVTSAQLQALTS